MARVAPYTSKLKSVYQCILEPDKDRRQVLLRPLFDGYAATCDYPGSFFIDDLMEMYPDAKIVLNKRSSGEAWAKSIRDALGFFGTRTYFWITCLIGTDYWHYYNHVAAKEMAPRRWGVEIFDPRLHDRHVEMVRRLAMEQGREVLEWEVTDGWGPLCKFLGKEVPKEEFPHVNDKATMKMITRVVVIRGILAWCLTLAAPVVVAYTWRWWRR